MTLIASAESFIGSLWFAGLCLLVGLILGHCGALGWVMKKLSK